MANELDLKERWDEVFKLSPEYKAALKRAHVRAAQKGKRLTPLDVRNDPEIKGLESYHEQEMRDYIERANKKHSERANNIYNQGPVFATPNFKNAYPYTEFNGNLGMSKTELGRTAQGNLNASPGGYDPDQPGKLRSWGTLENAMADQAISGRLSPYTQRAIMGERAAVESDLKAKAKATEEDARRQRVELIRREQKTVRNLNPRLQGIYDAMTPGEKSKVVGQSPEGQYRTLSSSRIVPRGTMTPIIPLTSFPTSAASLPAPRRDEDDDEDFLP